MFSNNITGPCFSALVLDGEQRAALAAVRSLGRRGIKLIVGSRLRTCLAGASKFCAKQVQYHDPYKTPDLFLDDVLKIVDQEEIGIVFPITDVTMSIVLKNSKRLKTVIPFASYEKYALASDKLYTVQLAKSLNIPVPDTLIVMNLSQLERMKKTLRFPVVLKPQSSLITVNNEISRTQVKMVASYDELDELVKTDIGFTRPFMIQERIQGDGLGASVLFKDGAPIATFCHRRLREKPPWGGVSVLCESVEAKSKMSEYAEKLLKAIGWHGVAMVEFKGAGENGTPVFMEINARFWGSLQLAIDAGADFVYLTYLLGMGGNIDVHESYNHSKLRWLLGDLDNCLISMKESQLTWRDKAMILFNFVKEFGGGARTEPLRRNDPEPFFWELSTYIKNIIKRNRSD